MSGRAGRRGIDDRGIVILMVDEKVPPAAGRNIVKGLPDPINSAFHLTYNMVLNLLRVEEINPEYMLERSFFQFQNQTAIPGLYEGKKDGLFIYLIIYFIYPYLLYFLLTVFMCLQYFSHLSHNSYFLIISNTGNNLLGKI